MYVVSAVIALAIALNWWCIDDLLRRSGLGVAARLSCCSIVSLNIGLLAVLGSMAMLSEPQLVKPLVIMVNLVVALAAHSLRQRWPVPADHRPLAWRRLPSPAAGGLVLIVLLLLMQVVLYSPTGFDAMAYHLPKLAELIDNGSPTGFASHYPHINESPWGSTYGLYFLWLLLGDTAFTQAGLLQLVAFVACAFVVRSIVADLGGRHLGWSRPAVWGVVLGVIVASPMLLLQGSSSRNDLLATAFCLVMVSAVTSALDSDRGRAWASTSIALFSFGTAGVFATKPNLLLQGLVLTGSMGAIVALRHRSTLRLLRARPWRTPTASIHRVAAAGCVVLSVGLLLPFAQSTASNLVVYGKVIGPASEHIAGEPPSGVDAVCRTTMTFAYEAKVGDTPSLLPRLLSGVSRAEQLVLREVAGVCGDALLSTRNNLTPDVDPFDGDWRNGSEDNQPSPAQLHVLIIGGVISVALLATRRLRGRQGSDLEAGRGRPLPLPAVVLCGALTLVVASMAAPWQYWANSRFMLPTWLFTIAASIVVIVEFLSTRFHVGLSGRVRRGLVGVLVVALTTQAAFIVAGNTSSPLPTSDQWGLVSRRDDWRGFARIAGSPASNPTVESIEIAVDAAVERECDVIGVTSRLFMLFPLWLAARDEGIRILPVDVINETERYELSARVQGVCMYLSTADVAPEGRSDLQQSVDVNGWIVWVP